MIMSDIKEHIRDIVSEMRSSTNHKDIFETIEDLEGAIEKLENQEKLLSIIETIALESDDPNIVELRKELFTTVKLIHNDQIEENFNKIEKISTSSIIMENATNIIVDNVFLNSFDDHFKKVIEDSE